MKPTLVRVGTFLAIGLFVLGVAASGVSAQESKSTTAAKTLTDLLDARSLNAMAAKEPNQQDFYVAALYFKGSQLLVVKARYAVALYITEKLQKREYREVYIDLNSASIPESKILVVDSKCDGVMATRDENGPIDTYETATKRYSFDGDWKKAKMTEEEYRKAHAEADDAYLHMLNVLIAQLKK